MKGANEVNRQYFQQAVLLCLQKALYYAGICSNAAVSYYAQNYAGIIRQGLALWKPGLMNLCWTMNSLSPVTILQETGKNMKVEYCCTLETICHTMPCRLALTDPENMDLNCHCTMRASNNSFCLYALYSLPSTTHAAYSHLVYLLTSCSKPVCLYMQSTE